MLTGTLLAQDVRLRPMRPIYVDSLGSGLQAPEGVAYDGSSRLIVADTGNGRLVVYDVSQETIDATSQIRLSQLPVPSRVRFAPDGGILVLDGKSHRIARLGADGSFQGYVEIPPAAGRRAALVKAFEVDEEGKLLVLENAGGRILVLDEAGNLLRTIAFAPEVRFLSDITWNRSGMVFAIDSVGRQVFVARKGDAALAPLAGSLEEDSAFPTSITTDGTGYLYISDRGGSGIVVLGENGSFQGRHSSRGRSQGFVWQPEGLDASEEWLFVADRGNNRVQLFEIVR
jgi:sugar lactone lactonase YvrE